MCPIWLPVFLLFFYNEPELGAGIDPGMALTPLPSLDGDQTHDLNDREPSLLAKFGDLFLDFGDTLFENC